MRDAMVERMRMHDRAQSWYQQRTSHWRDWPAAALLERKQRSATRVSAVIPARNEAGTVADVVGSLRLALAEQVRVALEAGHVVRPGSITASVPVYAGAAVNARFGGIGSVGITFTEER